ncbi:glycosyl hydrolases family 16 [Terrimicrobium sacchariphilum]|uniref:Glycosyl hydrolases family 16 n=2 Tax=Terrimicrobium sacchariphilum TaxID=690879 RepID=A0A146GBG8_TERSA|nr:glycosyl hydrolases family 16 [Terrimicrobium sacchariphilum]
MKEITAGLALALVSSGGFATEPTTSLGGKAKVEFPDRDKLKEAYEAPGWKTLWADEFETAGLPDAAKWNYEEGRVRNREDQYYVRNRRENARVENGHLIITARHEPWEGADVTSACLITLGKFDFCHGKLEIRARLPKGRGTWPALWLMGSNYEQAGWPHCGEIDLMEFVGFMPDVLHFTVHTDAFNHSRQNQQGTTLEVERLSEEFHRYGLLWMADELVWFFDGEPVFRYANAHAGASQWPFDHPAYILMNLAIGGTWGGREGVDPGMLPSEFVVDYVRVWQR